ncbi:MAG: hypothetical protein JW768_13790 [Chitinispirillaceae bacterium]|nr:hypothetical protein [Chitinispirillaceae bacterium]
MSLALVCICVQSGAQSILSLSSPIGLPSLHSTGPSQSIGGSGTGVANDFFGMADNPGNLGALTRSSFSSLISLDLLSIDDRGETTEHFLLSPRLISFAFPLKLAGTFCVSLDRHSDARFKYRAQKTYAFATGDVDTVDVGVLKNGGLTSWQVGWGYAIGTFIRLGMSFERLYLLHDEITMRRVAVSAVQAGYYSELHDTVRLVFRGNGFRGGLLVPYRKLAIGISGEYFFQGDAESKSFLQSPDTVTVSSQTFFLHLPPSLASGVSYTFSPSLFVAASAGVTLWSRYQSGVRLGSAVDDAFSFSCGSQFIPAPNLLVPRYWEIIQYRLGVRYAQLPSTTGSEYAVTLGFGLPFQQNVGLFDIIFDIGRRTDSGYAEYAENFIQVKLGLNAGKEWFQNTGIRY